ncbi:DeoR/GlpR family DNA-binding transcription regulator [Sediminibacillus albus]|uniref:DNA-binding transcriptional regulator of sugar metabolism, DeoR/GlpR family n=1 Tax=Sediminibacillus albus TaxID=407036 RepID=A0A1G8WGW6_9BACI|nr:DeoR/GlpR family DNA-binding transcription regulator [Sediminibacillus albus]SDJ77589.1 DNA-binding transcriptional regulator of sugar metabolism, DeoR/GlpR family [Sediminibacillus albus]
MLSIERYQRILAELEQQKIVKVSDLSGILNVTEKTIRIDLETLEKRGLLTRIHGGAVLVESEERLLPIQERQSGHSQVKKAIAEQAMTLVRPRETILMDGGSTTVEIAKLLGDMEVTVITNDLNIAHILQDKEKIQLLVPGGTRIPNSTSLMGAQATELLKKLHVNRVFFGATGISVDQGLTVFTSLHADWKKQIVECAEQVTLVADSSKFGKVALIQFAAIDQVNEIITDNRLDEQIKQQLEKRNIQVRVVKNNYAERGGN